MKIHIKQLSLLSALVSGFFLIATHQATAQSFINLHTFNPSVEGGSPSAGVVMAGDILYGVTQSGGDNGFGVLFSMKPDGTAYTILRHFSYSAGGDLIGNLTVSGNTIYAATRLGGDFGGGTIFKMNTDGTGYTNIHHFSSLGGSSPSTNYDGVDVETALVLSGNTLYGAAAQGGNIGGGTIFKINTDGTGFTTLHNFTGIANPSSTNTEGSRPLGNLLLVGNVLYGTASEGGAFAKGTVFKVNADGTGFVNLHSFTGADDSATPNAGLVLSGNTLYGTARGAGGSDYGVVFAVNTDGSGFTNLHNFAFDAGGATPFSTLALYEDTLYGTTSSAGGEFGGTIFAIKTNGLGFTNLHHFAFADGTTPYSGVILSGNTLYGTTYQGTPNRAGSVFALSITLPPTKPTLNIATANNQSVLFWPASGTNYIIESSTDLNSTNWVTDTNVVPVIAFTVTNSTSQKFFRLKLKDN